MISQVNASINNAFASNSNEMKATQKDGANISQQGDMSKIERIKESLESGEYKINIEALSQKIAEELL